MKRVLTIAALMIAASPLAFSQVAQSTLGQNTAAEQKGGNIEQEILKVGDEYDKAVLRGDAAALDHILADDYTLTSSTGEVSGKAREIERFKSGEVKFESGQASDFRLRVYGDTAVATGLWASKGQLMGKAFDNRERYTVVYAKRGGRWQIVTEHLTKIVAQPQRQPQQPAQQPAEKKP